MPASPEKNHILENISRTVAEELQFLFPSGGETMLFIRDFTQYDDQTELIYEVGSLGQCYRVVSHIRTEPHLADTESLKRLRKIHKEWESFRLVRYYDAKKISKIKKYSIPMTVTY